MPPYSHACFQLDSCMQRKLAFPNATSCSHLSIANRGSATGRSWLDHLTESTEKEKRSVIVAEKRYRCYSEASVACEVQRPVAGIPATSVSCTSTLGSVASFLNSDEWTERVVVPRQLSPVLARSSRSILLYLPTPPRRPWLISHDKPDCLGSKPSC
jgi:hypothetical protein